MFQVGDIVKHFKYNALPDSEKAQHKYIFRIEDFAIDSSDHTTSVVVYRAMYDNFSLYVRPYKEFVEILDEDKYPNAGQEHRFERLI